MRGLHSFPEKQRVLKIADYEDKDKTPFGIGFGIPLLAFTQIYKNINLSFKEKRVLEGTKYELMAKQFMEERINQTLTLNRSLARRKAKARHKIKKVK